MRRFTIKLLVLLLAFSFGLAVYYFYNFTPDSALEKDSQPENLNIETADKAYTRKDEQATTDFYEILPCNEENPFKKYSRKAVATRSVGIVNSRVSCGALPEYSKNKNNVAGFVSVSVLVDEFGEVMQASIASGNRLLHKSALQAARQTRFVPAILRGEPIKMQGMLIYGFDATRGAWLQKPEKPF